MSLHAPPSKEPDHSPMIDEATSTLHPLRFEPILKRLIWGGRRLETALGKTLGPGNDYAESWEVSDHRQDVSRVIEGPLQGADLRTLVRERSQALFGPSSEPREQFPLLVKFLDANQDLSVQVHPDDELGHRLVQDNGKTEAWVVVHAEPGSQIYAGLQEGVTRDRFAEALEENRVEPLLHRFPAKAGDCVFIPAGTVHAIGAGIVMAEIQQMSDATFRVYDWGRLGADGQPRELHIPQALESTNFEAGPVQPIQTQAEPFSAGRREHLVSCPYFTLDRLSLQRPGRVGTDDRFTILLGLEGRAEIRHDGRSYTLDLGQTLLLPAEIGPCEVLPQGEATILSCSIP